MKPAKRKPTTRAVAGHEPAFREIIGLIAAARHRAFQAVNTELIELYWRVGQYISRKLESAAWGEGVVDELARYISRKQPDMKGFTEPACFGCGSFMRFTAVKQKSHHWCDNYRGRTICSFCRVANAPKNESFICAFEKHLPNRRMSQED